MSAVESALVVLVPEAEFLVRPFRELHDPSAMLGVPAHITLLYPFKPPKEIDGAVLEHLSAAFARLAPITFVLGSVRSFPGVLYLAPDPAEPFRDLTRAIWAWYPEAPPYGGKWPDIVPHLSLASTADERKLDRIADEIALASQGRLPISANAREVCLLEKHGQRWATRTMFRLGC